MSTALRIQFDIYDIIEDYEQKLEEIPVRLKALRADINYLKSKTHTMGVVADDPRWEIPTEKELLDSLLKSSWRYVYNELQIEHIAPQTHLKHFKTLLESPPEFDAESIFSIFGEYAMNPRGMILEAMAEIFCDLDPFYKSHSNMRIGVKGLPKRVILSGCTETWAYGWRRVADVVNCLMRYRGTYDKCVREDDICRIAKHGNEYNKAYHSIPHHGNWYKDLESWRHGDDKEYEGLTFKTHKNGNCHVIFDKQAMDDINHALAEYYGEVLPDVYEHTSQKVESTEVAKDLQFYRTPDKAVRWVMNRINLYRAGRPVSILEPSCGDGALLDGIKEAISEKNHAGEPLYPNSKIVGVEYDSVRCMESRAKGYTVHNENFLEWSTVDRFDYVVMNPPFYGKHYMKHIKKAMEHLKEGGVLYSIVPVTARINHGLLDHEYDCKWCDLPVGSFRESGVNINTSLVRIVK